MTQSYDIFMVICQSVESNYLLTLSKINHAAEIIFKSHSPNILLAYMVAYVENSPWLSNAKKNNVRIVHVGSTQFDQHAQTINFFDLYFNFGRFERFTSEFGFENSSAEEADLCSYLEKRYDGKLISDKSGLNKKLLKQDELLRLFPKLFNEKKINVILFPNVFWDAGMSQLDGGVFKDSKEWLTQTVKFLSQSEKYNIIVRCHPAEAIGDKQKKGASHSVCEIFNGNLPSNVNIIEGDFKYSSYSLFDKMDICCVYNGTIGLEALLEGKKVSIGGPAPYRKIFMSTNFENPQQYFSSFNAPYQASNQQDIYHVRRYAYFYFIKTSIPWKLTDRAYSSTYYTNINLTNFSDLRHGQDRYFDHLVDCVLDETLLPEAW